LIQKKQKNQAWNQKLENYSKFHSAARAVRPSSSTRGLLPLFFTVFILLRGTKEWCEEI
jgi:hypothetical protein